MVDARVKELLQQLVVLERAGRDKDEQIESLERGLGSLDLRSENREMLSKDRAQELMSKAAGERKEQVLSVILATKSFGQEAAVVAAEFLKAMPDLTFADLSDIIAGRPEAEALEVLKMICGALPVDKVSALDLSENALGEKGIRALQDVIASLSALTEIKFMNNGLSQLSIELLSDFLPVANLRVLQFHNNMSGSGGATAAAKILAKCPKIEDFRMSSSRVRADGGLPLLKAISGCASTLVKINLSDSMFDAECTKVLIDTFPKFTKLTDLILRDTGIEKEPLLEALLNTENIPKLSILDLSGLEIDEDSAADVGKIIRSRPRLRKLWLDDNDLETPGAIALAKAATAASSLCMLESLSVQTNRIGKNGAIALTKFALANPTMKKLELNDNQICATGVLKIKEMLEQAGRSDVLGSLEENAESDDEDEDDEEDEEEDEDQLDDLTAAMNKVHI